jgi:flagellar biosynthesis/type III secretory pathway chaperone
MGASELSTELWRQRELLEQLLFKFEEERLLLLAGKSRWIPHATREVEAVVERLKTAGLSLSIAIVEVAGEWGLPDDVRLRDIAAAAPTGAWSEVLGSHLKALTALTGEIKAIRTNNDQLLRAALRSTQETLNLVSGMPALYGADGSADQSISPASLVDARL